MAGNARLNVTKYSRHADDQPAATLGLWCSRQMDKRMDSQHHQQ